MENLDFEFALNDISNAPGVIERVAAKKIVSENSEIAPNID